MPSFDFTSLLSFLMSLFEALKKLAEKLGFKFGEDESSTGDEADSSTDSSATE